MILLESVLPYWEQNIDLDVPSWFPYGKDYSPVSVNALCGEELGKIAELSLALGSEFIFLNSIAQGAIGTMSRSNIVDPGTDGFGFGFTMVFAYSKALESIILDLVRKFDGLLAGLTLCDIWDGDVLVDEFKVIMLIHEDLMFDESDLLKEILAAFNAKTDKKSSDISFFAEKFGYKRCTIEYETDSITLLQITQKLFDLELDATKDVIGPVPELSVPNMQLLTKN